MCCGLCFVVAPCVFAIHVVRKHAFVLMLLHMVQETHPFIHLISFYFMVLKLSLTLGLGVVGQAFKSLRLSFAQKKKGPPTHTLSTTSLSLN